ncbi:MAG: (2Fe-2S)-binding protein [Candidatus Latescibacterota bacterium]|nr:MAG: (2Fe-2S)-binding protein [Candidatus Latescibacterota bacterium]
MPIEIRVTVNGEAKVFRVMPGERLSEVLRREGYVSVKVGCSTGDCGTCTVLVDGEPIVSCLMLAAQADGTEITTTEGLAPPRALHPLQEAFLDEGAVQCGFCTPGMLLAAKALLDRNPSPTEAEIRKALAGTLCRCTGYENPVRAVRRAAERMREGGE